jgi:hypothetical protein
LVCYNGLGYIGFLIVSCSFGALGAVTLSTGKNNSNFKMNIGLFSEKKVADAITLPFINVGYRYQKPDEGFIFKAKIGTLVVGFGVGYAF